MRVSRAYTLPLVAPASRLRVSSDTLHAMPTKRTFDLIIATGVLLIPAFGLLRLAAKRWRVESNGVMEDVGDAVQLVIGK